MRAIRTTCQNQNPLPNWTGEGRKVRANNAFYTFHLLSARLVETNQGGRPGSVVFLVENLVSFAVFQLLTNQPTN